MKGQLCKGSWGMSCPCCAGLFGCDVHEKEKECPDYEPYMKEVKEWEYGLTSHQKGKNGKFIGTVLGGGSL